MGSYSSFSYNKDHWWGLMCIYKSCIDDRIAASLPYYFSEKVALSENQQTDPRGKKKRVDKQHPAHSQDKRAISEKSAPPWPWQRCICFVRGNIFTVILALWQENCGAALESTFQQNSSSSICDTEKKKKKKAHTSQVIMRTFLNVRPRRAFRTPEKCPSTCEGLIVWLINITSIVMNKNRARTGQVEITFAGLLRFHFWNLSHPSC